MSIENVYNVLCMVAIHMLLVFKTFHVKKQPEKSQKWYI